jgi:hypothetical protein
VLFSQRKGLKPIKSIIQIDALDEDLATRAMRAVSGTLCSMNPI